MEVRSQFAAEYARQSVEWMKDSLELTNREIGIVLNATTRTVIRWSKLDSSPSRSHREYLENINVLRHLLSVSFRDERAMQKWLMRPLPALQGRTPLNVILRGELNRIIELLGNLKAGAFV